MMGLQSLRTCLIVMVFCFPGVDCFAVEAITPPPGGTDVVSFDEDGDFKFSAKNAQVNGEWQTIQGMPFERAYRVNVSTQPRRTEHVEFSVPVNKTISEGNAVLLAFWIRRPKSGGQPGPSVVYVKTKPTGPSYEYRFSAYRDWQQHVRAFRAPADLDGQEATVTIHVGNSGPAIEVADLRLVDYGANVAIEKLPRSAVTYKGRAPNAQWRKDAMARIEKIRKGDLTIQVVDANGSPVEGAKVAIQMQRHAFGFGNVVNSQLLGGKEDSFPYTQKRVGTSKTSTWRDAEKYREIVREYFNWVTFESELRPHKWKEMAAETRRGRNARRLLTQQAVPWLQSHGIGIRGHYIAWGAIDFTEIEKAFVGNPEGHRKWLWDHMADILPGTADYVSEWDTINHIIGWGKHTYEIEYGGYDIYAEIMKEARRLAPNAGHTVNEGKVLPNGYKRDSYKRVIRFLNDRKQTPDTVGFMAHFELTSLTPPEELLSVYDDFGEIAPQLQLSEFDVETGDDEQLQADFYRDVMIATFSHPKFVSIVQWGFWENAHWKPAAALWRTDWTLKPSGRVFVDLVKKQWWTNEISETDTNGQCQLRGFLGDYRITVEHNEGMIEREFKLEKGESHVRIGIQ